MKNKIVICSDGTGNSGGYGANTNVWRIYNAVDSKNHIRIYDDGVGTNKNIVFKIFGLVFGWGLSRNIRQLYRELVLHYEHQDSDIQDSEIYLFGFSRGAHTVRLLTELICTFGILNKRSFANDSQMDKAIKQLQSHFKSAIRGAWMLKFLYVWKANDHIRLSEITEKLILAKKQKFYNKLDKSLSKNVHNTEQKTAIFKDIKIKFIGVWDTVSAVGVPIDEMRDNILFASHAFVDNKLNSNVNQARHALSIDEMRHTFKPELWDQSSNLDQNRIKQMWFAGVHSNVGGGYQKDQMSIDSLLWMIEEAGNEGLGFIKEKIEQLSIDCSNDGKMYDSRSGLSAIFRYKPRNILDLTQNSYAYNPKAQINIHDSVYKRIMGSPEEYAPINLPVVTPTQHVTCNKLVINPDIVNNPWNFIWLQRALHMSFMLFFVTFFVCGLRLSTQTPCVLITSTQPLLKLIQETLNTINIYNPMYVTNKILPGYINNPSIFFIVLAAFLILMYFRKKLKTHLKNIGNIYWNRKTFNANKVDSQRLKTNFILSTILYIAQKIRNIKWINNILIPLIYKKLIPFIMSLLIVSGVIYLVYILFNLVQYLIGY